MPVMRATTSSQNQVDRAEQTLTARLIEAQEEERKRIGRELHDGLNQQLAMFAVELGLLAREAPADATSLIDSILSLRQRAECLSEELRQISHQLHPATLEHVGLHSALRSLCDEYTKYSGVRFWFSSSDEIERVPSDTAICLYRITQEALRNIVKHSGTREAWIRIRHYRGGVRLYIIDRGVGFNVESAYKAGLGLISMRERVQMVQGRIHIKSLPTVGTAIRIALPVISKE